MHWRRKWQPTPVFLPGESQGQGSLVACHLWGRTELDTTERVHFSLSCIGERNGNPLQCSCRENLRDGGAWWPAIYGVAQSQTRLKRLSSSSSLSLLQEIFPTQGISNPGSNPSLPHCRQILYQLSHKGSPRILEWVAYPFSSRSS